MHFEFAYFYFVHIRLELKRKIRSYTPVRTRLWRLWICFKTFVAPFLPTRYCPWIFFLDFRGLKRRYSVESRGGGGGVRSAWMRGKENAVFSLVFFPMLPHECNSSSFSSPVGFKIQKLTRLTCTRSPKHFVAVAPIHFNRQEAPEKHLKSSVNSGSYHWFFWLANFKAS